MKNGIRITIIVASIFVLMTVSYFLFVKKNSKIYLLNKGGGSERKCNKIDGTWNPETSVCETNPATDTAPVVAPTNTGGGSGSSSGSSSTCDAPDTPFKNTAEGDKFRAWVQKNYKSVADKWDLDPVGTGSNSFNNCYIRSAFAEKTSGGRTIGSIYIAGNSEGTDLPTKPTTKPPVVEVTPQNAVGKMVFPKGGYVIVRSEPKINDGTLLKAYFDDNRLGAINSPNIVGKVTNFTLDSKGKTWFYIVLKTPLMVDHGAGNNTNILWDSTTTGEKIGWVRGDMLKF